MQFISLKVDLNIFFSVKLYFILFLAAWFNLFWDIDQFFTVRCILWQIRMGVREEWVWMSEGLFLWKANYTVPQNGQNGAQWLMVTEPRFFDAQCKQQFDPMYLKLYVVHRDNLIRAWDLIQVLVVKQKKYKLFFLINLS